ncbi:MAG: ATP-binding cassette domain-containing protein [Pseudomonadota bacterium]
MTQGLSTKQKNAAAAVDIVLSVQRLVQTFGDRTPLSIDHWSVRRGLHGVIEGPSGSGKSTLLHLIAGLRRPTSGRIDVLGQDLGRLSNRELDRLRGGSIGIVLQRFHLIEALDVLDNLRLAQSLAGVAFDVDRADALLDQVGLTAIRGKKPSALSEGERQRVAILRAVINKPALLIADEPTSALDDRHAEAILDLLITQADAAGATLVMATHDARVKERLPIGLRLGDMSASEGAP